MNDMKTGRPAGNPVRNRGRNAVRVLVGIMMWTGLAGGGVLAQATLPPVSPPGGSLYGPRMTPPASSGEQEGPSKPCAQATRLLTRQMEWHRRIDEGIRKIHDAVRQMDETVLEGLEEEIAEMERAHRELEDASESCRSYVARLQLLTPCDQIPYLEEALSGAQALLSATVDLSIKQSMVLPGLMNVQMMPGVGGYPGSLPWGTGGGFTWTPAGVTPVDSMGLEPNRHITETLQRLQQARSECAAGQQRVP